MSDATCETCPWFRSEDDTCRKNAPVPLLGEDEFPRLEAWWPGVAFGLDWCGEHPDRRSPLGYWESARCRDD